MTARRRIVLVIGTSLMGFNAKLRDNRQHKRSSLPAGIFPCWLFLIGNLTAGISIRWLFLIGRF